MQHGIVVPATATSGEKHGTTENEAGQQAMTSDTGAATHDSAGRFLRADASSRVAKCRGGTPKRDSANGQALSSEKAPGRRCSVCTRGHRRDCGLARELRGAGSSSLKALQRVRVRHKAAHVRRPAQEGRERILSTSNEREGEDQNAQKRTMFVPMFGLGIC